MSNKIVVIVECAAGLSGQVGTSWFTTGVFAENAPLHAVRDWAAQVTGGSGNVILTEPIIEPDN